MRLSILACDPLTDKQKGQQQMTTKDQLDFLLWLYGLFFEGLAVFYLPCLFGALGYAAAFAILSRSILANRKATA